MVSNIHSEEAMVHEVGLLSKHSKTLLTRRIQVGIHRGLSAFFRSHTERALRFASIGHWGLLHGVDDFGAKSERRFAYERSSRLRVLNSGVLLLLCRRLLC